MNKDITFSAIITAHNSDPNPMLDCVRGQTYQPSEIFVGLSGGCKPVDDMNGVVVKEFPDMQDYGYAKRNEFAKLATGNMIGFFSCDDSYRRDYIELMIREADKAAADVAWCHYASATYVRRNIIPFKFIEGNATLGNFVMRRLAFNSIGGFQAHRNDPGNPGYFDAGLIAAINETPRIKVVEVPFVLYFHNYPVDFRVVPTVWGVPTEGE